MGEKTTKLSIKRETLRRLDALTDDQLRRAAGGTKIGEIQQPAFTTDCGFLNTTFCAGIRTTGGPTIATLNQTCRCTTV